MSRNAARLGIPHQPVPAICVVAVDLDQVATKWKVCRSHPLAKRGPPSHVRVVVRSGPKSDVALLRRWANSQYL